MADNENPEPTCVLPTELLFHLFEFLTPKALVKCREVCLLWRDVIDEMLHDGTRWEKFCRQDFTAAYKTANLKFTHPISWFEIYRSLSLWPQLAKADETIAEFCHATRVGDEIRSIVVLEGGLIQVVQREKIVHYNLATLELNSRLGPAGQFMDVIELENAIVTFGMGPYLRVIHKQRHGFESDLIFNEPDEDHERFNDVKKFLIHDKTLYFSTATGCLFSFDIDYGAEVSHLADFNSLVGALGFSDGCINILTMDRKIYTYSNNIVTEKLHIRSGNNLNLMDCLYRYNMLLDLDWNVYYIILSDLKKEAPVGLIDIFLMRIHIDLILVGTKSGSLILYHKPFINGELDLYKSIPLKVYNFTKFDAILLCAHPILSIEVVGTKDGHQILVGMTKKILVITYKHQFLKIFTSKSVEP